MIYIKKYYIYDVQIYIKYINDYLKFANKSIHTEIENVKMTFSHQFPLVEKAN